MTTDEALHILLKRYVKLVEKAEAEGDADAEAKYTLRRDRLSGLIAHRKILENHSRRARPRRFVDDGGHYRQGEG